MKKHSLIGRGTAVVVCTSICATLWACGGDSSSTDDGGGAGDGTAGSSSSSSSSGSGSGSGSGSSSGSGSGSSSGVRDSGSSDSGSGSGSSGGSSDSGDAGGRGADSGGDASGDGGASDGARTDSTIPDAMTDGSPGRDGSVADGSMADASEAGPPAPLSLCTVFDSKFLLDESEAGTVQAQAARTNTWANAIASNLANATGAYIGGDCSFSGFATALAGPPDTTPDYVNALDGWVQQFLGCPVGDGGALTYGLIPASLAPPKHVFTRGDLDKLSSDFVDAINNTITCAGDCLNPSTLPDGGTLSNVAPLTATQIANIRAQIAYLQSQVSTPPVDSGAFSFSPATGCDMTTCAVLCPSADAGASDASDAGASDASDAGTSDASDAGASDASGG